MTKFLITDTFKFSYKNSTVFLGDIISGTVKPGQTIVLTAKDGRPELRLKIAGVDYADTFSPRTTQIGLMVTPGNDEELNTLKDIKIKGETIDIID